MTEEEAKTKICCGPRAAGLGEDIECRGSECMAWRVVREEVSGTDADGFGYVRSAVTGGFCGLAGAPR